VNQKSDIHPPLVSIIVRTKDRPQLVRMSLRSIAAQTYRNIEVVLVNDGGVDLDIDDFKSLLDGMPLVYVKLDVNRGRAHAANVGIGIAGGAYIGFLDDDDEYYPEHVESLLGVLHEGEGSFAYSDSEIVTRQYDFTTMAYTDRDVSVFRSRDFSLYDLLLENYIPLINVLFSRAVIDSIGAFDEAFAAYEDWDFFIRCGSRFPLVHLNRVTARYVQWSPDHQIAQSRDFWDMLAIEYDKVVQKHRDKITGEVMRYCRDRLNVLNAGNEEKDRVIAEKESEISRLTALTGEKEDIIGRLRCRNERLEGQIHEKEEYIRTIHGGRGWKLLCRYYRLRDKLLEALR
jgi:glycosyltransferase involved in cell wall biosynthesis